MATLYPNHPERRGKVSEEQGEAANRGHGEGASGSATAEGAWPGSELASPPRGHTASPVTGRACLQALAGSHLSKPAEKEEVERKGRNKGEGRSPHEGVAPLGRRLQGGVSGRDREARRALRAGDTPG